MKLKIYIALATLFTLAMGGYFTFKKTDQTNNTPSFVVGTAAGYAPWVSINEQNQYEGFDIDVIQAVAKKMNKKLILKDLGTMASLLMALEQNKIDAIIWGMSITPDRLKRMAMVRYQGDTVTSFPLLFWQKIPANIFSITDMKNMTICVEPASSQDTVLNAYNAINKLPTERVDDALLNIQYGKADAAFVEPAIAKKFKKRYPEIKIIEIPLPLENQEHGVGICIKPKNIPLIHQVEQAIKSLEQQNIIQQLEKTWDIS